MTGKLKSEIRQTRPFHSLEEEVVLSMMRTAELLAAPMTELLRATKLSFSQYNVLRILRGAGAEGLPCGEISERMVRRDPDLTRLLDRLEAAGLVARARGTADRRVVIARITDAGLGLLDSLAGKIETAVENTLSHMPRKRLEALRDLLEQARTTDPTVRE